MLEIKFRKALGNFLRFSSEWTPTAQQGQIRLVKCNGAGKTIRSSTVSCAFGLQAEIRSGGKGSQRDLLWDYLPEERSLMPKLTIFWAGPLLRLLKANEQRHVKEKLADLMEKLQVKGNWPIKIKSFPKGNQQKGLHRSSPWHEPKLIILDEPLAASGSVNTEVLKQAIFKEKERGATIVFFWFTSWQCRRVSDDVLISAMVRLSFQASPGCL